MAKKKIEPTLTVVDVEVSKLREHPHNVKIGHNVKVIAESIKEHGWDQPIVANRKINHRFASVNRKINLQTHCLT